MSTVDLPKPWTSRLEDVILEALRGQQNAQELEDEARNSKIFQFWVDGLMGCLMDSVFFFATKNMGVDCKNRGKLGLDVGIQKNRQGLMDTSKVLLMPNWSKFDEMFEKVSSRWWFLFHYIPLPKKQVKFQDLIELFVCIRLNSESSLHRIVGLGYNTTIHVHLETGAEFRLTIYNILWL